MHQGRSRTRRDVTLRPAQAPRGRGPYGLQTVEGLPKRPDLRQSGAGVGLTKENQVLLGRTNGMNFRQFAPEPLGQAGPVAAEGLILNDAGTKAGALDE